MNNISKRKIALIINIIIVISEIIGLIIGVKGPYPFLMVKAQNPLMTLLWAIIIVSGSYIVGAGLNLLNKKTQNKRS